MHISTLLPKSANLSLLKQYIQDQNLPPAFAATVDTYWLPLVAWLLERHRAGQTLVLGINGAQGTGKSTLANVLALLLENQRRRVVVLSLDDLYLPRRERTQLAAEIHPLLQTRGVPGTHDAVLGINLIQRLKCLIPPESVCLPRFNKALDERMAEADWTVCRTRPDFILFEGWCVGIPAQGEQALRQALNPLERKEDPDGTWRRYVNAQLGGVYQKLFRQLDYRIFLKAPDFQAIQRWRQEQEDKNARHAGNAPNRIMDKTALIRFIQHYERLTRFSLEYLPAHADVVFELDHEHIVTAAVYRGEMPA